MIVVWAYMVSLSTERGANVVFGAPSSSALCQQLLTSQCENYI